MKLPRFARLVFALVLFSQILSSSASPAGPQASLEAPGTFFVSPKGNDAWSGKLERANSAGNDGPFRTIAHARDAIRQSNRDAHTAATVYLRAGTYELKETLMFSPQDSGNPGAPVTYAAYPGETSVLSGGRVITGWTQDKNGLWTAQIPEAKNHQWYFRELFVKGERRQRARTPNTGYFNVQGQILPGDPGRFQFNGNDIRPEWAKAGDVEVVNLNKWQVSRMFIRSVDTGSHMVTLSRARLPIANEENSRYWIENNVDGLDSPGEWYLNSRDGVLYYRPMPGEDMARAQAIAPALQQLLRFDGSLDHPVHNIVLRGLTFSYTDWTMSDTGWEDKQSAPSLPAAVEGTTVLSSTVERCVFTHLGQDAVGFGRGSKQNQIMKNEMSDLGGGAIKIGDADSMVLPNEFVPSAPPGGERRGFQRGAGQERAAEMAKFLLDTNNYQIEPGYPHSEAEASTDNVISDNRIHDTGQVFASAAAIWIGQSNGNTISHNEIHDTTYDGISVGWSWGYGPSAAVNNIIEYNHLYNIGRGLLSDFGAIYVLGSQPGTIVRNNLIHDVRRYDGSGGYFGFGIYLDSGSSEVRVQNNIVYRADDGIHENYGMDNTVDNNVVAFTRYQASLRTHAAPNQQSLTFEHNILYASQGDLLHLHPQEGITKFDNNLYYRTDGQPVTINAFQRTGTFEQWRQILGQDDHSLVADPRFVDPEKGNFALRSDSPALGLGIKSIDLSRAGPRQ